MESNVRAFEASVESIPSYRYNNVRMNEKTVFRKKRRKRVNLMKVSSDYEERKVKEWAWRVNYL